MSRPAPRRLLHIVRGELPAPVVADGDVVVYASEGEPGWRTARHDGEPIHADRLVQLIFEADGVAVW